MSVRLQAPSQAFSFILERASGPRGRLGTVRPFRFAFIRLERVRLLIHLDVRRASAVGEKSFTAFGMAFFIERVEDFQLG